ncbi:MAG: NUDIX hydrolase, partial [Desulforhopalus sp.]
DLQLLIKKNLQRFSVKKMAVGACRQAAVAITLVDYRREGGVPGLSAAGAASCAVILTRRSGRLRSHAGQWAFPGGSIDKGEAPVDTALRELAEEVGLHLSSDRVIGYLDDFVTRSGFHIVPVVVWGGMVGGLKKNEKEVASLHRVPCAELFRRDAPILESSEEGDRPILYMPVGDTCIATPTAAILYQFREVALAGRTTRVSHFEQPHFAWQ